MSDVVLVTGGASGIGAAVATRFARAGANVVIADVSEEAGKALAEDLAGLFVRTDVTSQQENEAAVQAAVDTFGGLDVVHLNAGIGGPNAHGADFDLARYRRTLAVNLDGPLFGIRAAWPVLRENGGAIVVTSSIAGLAPAYFDPVYSATKHAVIGLVRSFAMAWAESAVTINAVCPGFIATPLIAEALDAVREQGFAVADPDVVAQAVESIVAGGQTGNAWIAQQGREPELAGFHPVTLSKLTG